MKNELIIEIPYAGLGDHLFHSHLPRIAKETGGYKKVFISKHSFTWNVDCMRIVWELNPYVDGIIDEKGNKCDLHEIANRMETYKLNGADNTSNLLDEIMFDFGLDDGKRYHEPELYYKPKFVQKFNKIIFDPNFISYVGEINRTDVKVYFKRNKIRFDSIMKIRTEKALHKYSRKNNYIETQNLEDFCDLIFSCKEIHCFTSGTATISSALGKSAYVYYGNCLHMAFRHSRLHTYHFIEPCNKTIIINYIKTIVKKILSQKVCKILSQKVCKVRFFKI